MKCVVTGGAGFIGSHLCAALLKAGHDVICIDNFVTGNMRNIANLLKLYPEKFRLITHDITSTLPDNFFKEITHVDQIYHLACPGSPADYQKIPLQTLWVLAAGTKNMLEIANRYDAAFLFVSNSENYDYGFEKIQQSHLENTNLQQEINFYSEGQRFAEALAISYHAHYQFPLAIVRLLNVYGPQMHKHDDNIISTFIAAALDHEPLRIFGDEHQNKAFCFIDDVIEEIMHVMKQRTFTAPINLGCTEEINLRNLAELIKELAQSESVIIYKDKPQVHEYTPDSFFDNTEKRPQSRPKDNLRERLLKTIEYFRNLI